MVPSGVIPSFVLLTVPIAFGFVLVSNNLGRMFCAAYVPVIAYALVVVGWVFEGDEGRAGRKR